MSSIINSITSRPSTEVMGAPPLIMPVLRHENAMEGAGRFRRAIPILLSAQAINEAEAKGLSQVVGRIDIAEHKFDQPYQIPIEP